MSGSLFPEMEREIQEGRLAERREKVQHARAYLQGRDLIWLMNRLLEKPMTEHEVMLQAIECAPGNDKDRFTKGVEAMAELISLHCVGKLWRKSLGTHFGSGEETYLYGVRKVHNQSAEIASREEESK